MISPSQDSPVLLAFHEQYEIARCARLKIFQCGVCLKYIFLEFPHGISHLQGAGNVFMKILANEGSVLWYLATSD